MIYNLQQYFCIYKKYSHHTPEEKTMETRIIKNNFNKNERRCRDVKTQEARKQGWEANIYRTQNKTNHFHITLRKYLTAIKQNTKSCTYVGLYGLIWGPMLASHPCLHAFWVLTSLHLLSFYLVYL